MDARVDGVPVTPRIGKPVEVNALWVNGLAAVAALCQRVGVDPAELTTRHDTARASFAAPVPDARPATSTTWSTARTATTPRCARTSCSPGRCRTRRWYPDPAVLDADRRRAAHAARAAQPRHRRPGYRGHHRGSPADRDDAYHQGTVWPWLIGPYVQARRRTGINDLSPLIDLTAHLREYGLGSVSETADGDAPHAATGCPFQAWSVADVSARRKRRICLTAASVTAHLLDRRAGKRRG